MQLWWKMSSIGVPLRPPSFFFFEKRTVHRITNSRLWLPTDVRTGGCFTCTRSIIITCAKGSAKGVVSLGLRLDRKSRDRRVGRPEPLVKKCFPKGSFEYGSKANPLEMRSAHEWWNDDGYKLLNDLWIQIEILITKWRGRSVWSMNKITKHEVVHRSNARQKRKYGERKRLLIIFG